MTIYIREGRKFPIFFWFPLWMFPCRILAAYVIHADPAALRAIIRKLRSYRRQNGRLTLVDINVRPRAHEEEGTVVRIKV